MMPNIKIPEMSDMAGRVDSNLIEDDVIRDLGNYSEKLIIPLMNSLEERAIESVVKSFKRNGLGYPDRRMIKDMLFDIEDDSDDQIEFYNSIELAIHDFIESKIQTFNTKFFEYDGEDK